MSSGANKSYGDPLVDEILAEAEVYARYQMDALLEKQMASLMTLPDSDARAKGRSRLSALMNGEPSDYVPAAPPPYIDVPNRTLHPPLTGTATAEQNGRRSPYDFSSLAGLTADEVLAILGSPDSESVGQYWFSHELRSTVRRRGEDFVATDAAVSFPNIAPGRPYVVWSYANMLGPQDDETMLATWSVYLLVPDRVVVGAARTPYDIDF